MALDQSLLAELLKTYLLDLDAQSETLDEGLLSLERDGVADDQRTEAYAAIMRAAHNLKGGARGLGLDEPVEVFHRMETLFARLRDDNALPSRSFVNHCLGVMEAVRSHLTSLAAGSASDADLLAQIDALEKVPLVADAENRTEDALENGVAPASAQTTEAEAAVPAEKAALHEAETKIAAKPQPSEPADTASANQLVRVQLSKLGKVSALAEELLVTRTGMAGNQDEVRRLHADLSHSLRHLKQLHSHWSEGSEHDVLSLEKLFMDCLDSLGEYNQRVETLQISMRYSVSALGRLTKAMGYELQLMRLMPARSLLKPVMVTGRSLAMELGKQVDIELIGDEIGMDRLLLERLQAPLNHLLRNAIDHGIESPEQRRRQGKPETGKIGIRLQQEGNYVKLSMTDDGKGIDADAVAAAAVRNKLIDREAVEAMSREEKLQLILESGLSSREHVTHISGRGVGMDEVNTSIRALHGNLGIETEQGTGTCISLRLPIMLAQERGLVVSAAGQRFVLPTLSMERVLNFEAEDVIQVEGSQAIMVDGRATPLRSLAETLELGIGKESAGNSHMGVTMGHGQSRVTFLVDEVDSEQEIVVKPLASPLKVVRNVKGATYDDNGNVVIVINAQEIIQSALQRQAMATSLDAAGDEAEIAQHILVVDDSLTTRTLEKNILEANGYRVTVCVNGRDALKLLHVGEEEIDMVVTDVEMPLMDGFELTSAIKAGGELAKLPVIIVTSLERDDQRRQGMEVGADAYIVKSSFESKALLETVQRLL